MCSLLDDAITMLPSRGQGSNTAHNESVLHPENGWMDEGVGGWSLSALTFTLTGNLEGPIKLIPSLYVFGLWDKARVPGENPRRHRENMQTPQRNTLTRPGNRIQETSCCEVTVLTYCAWIILYKIIKVRLCIVILNHSSYWVIFSLRLIILFVQTVVTCIVIGLPTYKNPPWVLWFLDNMWG